MPLRSGPAAFLMLPLVSCGPAPEPPRFQTPPGFTVETVARAEVTGSIVAFTFDSLGRPVISQERGRPALLLDKDGDGLFETSKVFTAKVNNCQGLWFDGRKLYGVCNDNSTDPQAGLFTFEDKDGDDQADDFFLVNGFEGRMQEHGPHEIRRGPDGLPTIILGNHTGAPEYAVEPQSPMALRSYRESQLLPRYMDARGHAAGILAPGGTIARLDRPAPGERYTLLAGGFRNAYSHAYNREGELFTMDSDMEWDVNMPWYRPVRTVHVTPGGDYGWRTGSGKWPAYFLDSLPPARELGRGSPVGIEFYRHHLYPEEYRDALFEGDWSRGRILVTQFRRAGATYSAGSGEPKEFVHGEPLNVTDLEVGPDGLLYFSTGGRDTEGGLYRVRYTPSWWSRLFQSTPTGVRAALRQPQPLSSWGHSALVRIKQEMGASWAAELERIARSGAEEPEDRVEAAMLLQRLGPAPGADLVRALLADEHASTRAAGAYLAGLQADGGRALAALALKDTDAFVRRRGLEAMVRLRSADPSDLDNVYKLTADPDRFVRYAARIALERHPRPSWAERALAENNPTAAAEGLLALTRTAGDASLDPVLDKEADWLRRTGLSFDDRLRLLRAFQVTAAEIAGGLPAARRKQFHDILYPQFTTTDERLNRELARTLAYCNQPEAIYKILAAIPRTEENQPLQIHYVYCLRAIKPAPMPYCVAPPGRPLPEGCGKYGGWTAEQKSAIVAWFAKASQWRGGASFAGFLNLLFDDLLEAFSESEKKLAYERVPAFAPGDQAAADGPERPGYRRPSVLGRQRGVAALSAQEVFEYQMFHPVTQRAKAADGLPIFEKECASCHRFGALGKDFGPDLTTLSSRFKKKDVLEAMLWPSKTVSDQYKSVIVETTGGEILNGLPVRRDSKGITLRLADSDRPVEISADRVKSSRESDVSIMPEGLLDAYTNGQIAALVAFLQAGPPKEGK